LTALGVPLKNIATNLSAKASFGMNLDLVIPSIIVTPITGTSTVFANVTIIIAVIGSLESGLGIDIRENEAPRMIRESGMVISPTKLAGRNKSKPSTAVFYSRHQPVSRMKDRGGFPSGPVQFGPPILDASVKRAFNCGTKAQGRETARVIVTGVTSTPSDRTDRNNLCQALGVVSAVSVGEEDMTETRELFLLAREGGGAFGGWLFILGGWKDKAPADGLRDRKEFVVDLRDIRLASWISGSAS